VRRLALVFGLIGLACSRGGEGGSSPPPAGPDAGAAAPEAAPAEVGQTVTLPSGVKITHRVIGSGASPQLANRITVQYRGTFPNGKVFDSSVDHGGPASFVFSKRLLDCWKEGLPLMKVGGKAELVCPPETAFGEKGQPPKIPPDATLQFEVELLSIQ